MLQCELCKLKSKVQQLLLFWYLNLELNVVFLGYLQLLQKMFDIKA